MLKKEEEKEKDAKKKPEPEKRSKRRCSSLPVSVFGGLRILKTIINSLQRGTKRKSTRAPLSDSNSDSEDSAPPKTQTKPQPKPQSKAPKHLSRKKRLQRMSRQVLSSHPMKMTRRNRLRRNGCRRGRQNGLVRVRMMMTRLRGV